MSEQKSSKAGALGTASDPIHVVADKEGKLMAQIWSTIRALGLTLIIMAGVGAVIKDIGIGKGNDVSFDKAVSLAM